MDNTTMITMPLARYEELIRTSNQYSILIETLKSAAELNWKKDGLTFSDEIVSKLLFLFEPVGFAQKLTELQEKEGL